MKFSETYKSVCLIQLGLCLAVFVIGALVIPFGRGFSLAPSLGSYASGIALGYIFSCIKLFMLEKTLEKSIEMDKDGASNYTRLMYMARYFITLVVSGAAAVIPQISLLGMFFGLVLLQPAALIAGRKEKEK